MSEHNHPFWRSCLGAFVAAIVALAFLLPTFGVTAYGADKCFAREGKTSIVDRESTAQYKRKLFLTPDGIARYVFLTNRRDDGDRSAAIYRAQPRKGAFDGNYWLTATLAADQVRGDHRNVRVRRFDAPLPASLASVLHELWLAVCQQSRRDEEALPSAPTGIFSVVTAGGPRLTVVTTSLVDEHSLCLSMLELGESLMNYAKMPSSKRIEAARKIEKEAYALLKRVKQSK
jgi:hypothetical protein